MFYSEELLSRSGALGQVWLAANMEKKLSRAEFLKTDITSSVHTIVDDSGVPLALRLSGQLLLGVVRIYNKKTIYLMEDCNEALLKLKMAFRAGNVDMDKSTVAVAKTHTLTLQNKITDLDLLLLPEPTFDLGLPDFGAGSTSSAVSAAGPTRRQRQMRLDEPMLISSASHQDITLPELEDAIDIGRGLARQQDLDDFGAHGDSTFDLGLNFDEAGDANLDLGLDFGDAELSRHKGDEDNEGYAPMDMGGGDDYADLLAEGRGRRIGQEFGSEKETSDIETGLTAALGRAASDDLDLRRELELAGSRDDLQLPSSTRDHDQEFGLLPSSPHVPGSPGSPGGPPTPTEGADILGNIEVTTDLGADESARRSVLGEEDKLTPSVEPQQPPRARRRLGPRHAAVDRLTEIETTNQQIQSNRATIVRERSLLPTDSTAFALMEMSQNLLMASMFISQRDNPALARLMDPEFVSSRMTELDEQQERLRRKRSISALEDSEEGGHPKSMRPGSPSLGFGIEEGGTADMSGAQDYDLSEFPNARRIGENGEYLPERDTEADRQKYEEGDETAQGADFGEAVFETTGSPIPDLGLDLELEDERENAERESDFYSVAGPSGISQYTVKAANILKENIDKLGLGPSPEELEEIRSRQPDSTQPPLPSQNHLRTGIVDLDSLVHDATSPTASKKGAKSTRVKMFFEMLVLATKDAVKLEQPQAFGEISVRPKEYLYNEIWDGNPSQTEEQPEEVVSVTEVAA